MIYKKLCRITPVTDLPLGGEQGALGVQLLEQVEGSKEAPCHSKKCVVLAHLPSVGPIQHQNGARHARRKCQWAGTRQRTDARCAECWPSPWAEHRLGMPLPTSIKKQQGTWKNSMEPTEWDPMGYTKMRFWAQS